LSLLTLELKELHLMTVLAVDIHLNFSALKRQVSRAWL